MTAAGAQRRRDAITLRPYQADSVERLRAAFRAGHRRVLYVLPTGGGKTVVFCFVLSAAVSRGRRVVILVHREELIEQTRIALQSAGIAFGIVAPDQNPSVAPVQIASVATLARRLDRYRGSFDLLVVDEAHHATASSWRTIIAAYPSAAVLGVSATPERLDGRGLGDVFQHMVIGPSVAELTRLGYLAPAVVYAPGRMPNISDVKIRGGDFSATDLEPRLLDRALIGDAVEHYSRLAAGRPAIAFCCSIRHSEEVTAGFAAAGFRAAHVDGETPTVLRHKIVAALAAGRLDVLANCGLIAEGFDAPAVGAALLLRPTRSLAMHLQMVGRALRPAPGKDNAVIIDHAGNTLRHGLPDAPRHWTLEGQRINGTGEASAPLRRCRSCGAMALTTARVCPGCGRASSPSQLHELRQVGGALVEFAGDPVLDRLRAMSYPAVTRWAGTDRDRLALVAAARGYQPGWVWHALREGAAA